MRQKQLAMAGKRVENRNQTVSERQYPVTDTVKRGFWSVVGLLAAFFGLISASPSSPKPHVRFLVMPDIDAVGRQAADLVADQLEAKPHSIIIFPTGKTPLRMYADLRHRPELHWDNSRLFHLDEYVATNARSDKHPYETFAEYMRRELWDYIGGRKYYFGNYTQDPAAYERLILEKGGPDLVILGIGGNGHVAFNEPGSPQDSPARVITLAEQTMQSNFGGVRKPGYPTEAVTLGLKTILAAKKIILLATGSNKREIVRRVFDPKTRPSESLPASWLKLHPDVTVVTDFDVTRPMD